MRSTAKIVILLLSVFLLACGCKRGDSDIRVITDFGNGLRYEQWTDQSGSPRVLVRNGLNSFMTIVAGDVIACERSGRYIFGEKVPAVPPAAWMARDWEQTGYFLLNPSTLDQFAPSGEENDGKKVRWFKSKDALEQALKSVK